MFKKLWSALLTWIPILQTTRYKMDALIDALLFKDTYCTLRHRGEVFYVYHLGVISSRHLYIRKVNANTHDKAEAGHVPFNLAMFSECSDFQLVWVGPHEPMWKIPHWVDGSVRDTVAESIAEKLDTLRKNAHALYSGWGILIYWDQQYAWYLDSGSLSDYNTVKLVRDNTKTGGYGGITIPYYQLGVIGGTWDFNAVANRPIMLNPPTEELCEGITITESPRGALKALTRVAENTHEVAYWQINIDLEKVIGERPEHHRCYNLTALVQQAVNQHKYTQCIKRIVLNLDEVVVHYSGQDIPLGEWCNRKDLPGVYVSSVSGVTLTHVHAPTTLVEAIPID